jgi:hypothetical protein
VPLGALVLTRPVLCYSNSREAYVLRLVGNRTGPVLRRDRRDRQIPYVGVERRRNRAPQLPPV